MQCHVVGASVARQREAPNWRRLLVFGLLTAFVYYGGGDQVDRPKFRAEIRAKAQLSLEMSSDGLRSRDLRVDAGVATTGPDNRARVRRHGLRVDAGDAAAGPGNRARCTVQAHSEPCGFGEVAIRVVPANIACPEALIIKGAGASGTSV